MNQKTKKVILKAVLLISVIPLFLTGIMSSPLIEHPMFAINPLLSGMAAGALLVVFLICFILFFE